MIRKHSASLAAVAMLASVSGTAAGGRALECYEPIHRPALYDTVYEDVMLSPGGQVVDYDAPIFGTYQSVDQIGPARVTYETAPAVTRTLYHTVKVDNGGYAWEWRVIHGRKVLCKSMAQGPLCACGRNGPSPAGARPARRSAGGI
ncbi:hypothetical protein ACVOMV_13960 [Mesorhizobium atlanticum]